MIEKYDYILSVGAFFENSDFKKLLLDSLEENCYFTYTHPIDNFELKDKYCQFIKYEVASEEAILALVLYFFAKSSSLTNYLQDLDIGYLSAESSAGEEEFEDSFKEFEKAKNKALFIGDDLTNHERVENIVKLLANIKKYTSFKLIFEDKKLENLVENCSDLNLDEVDELSSYNGTILYFTNQEKSDILRVSKTFANIAKIEDKDIVKLKFATQVVTKKVTIDGNLLGTIALIDDSYSGYKFIKVVVEKEQN